MTRPLRAPARRSPALAALLLGALLPIACSSPGAQTDEPGFPTDRPTILVTDPPPTIEITPVVPSQSETGWGPIWDEVPDSFPVPVDASVADAPQGPVSGAWTVPVAAASAPELAGYYRDALDEIGWGTGIDGPLEDGSYVVWSSSGYGCDTQTTILPRGDESLITVLFGAGCPFR